MPYGVSQQMIDTYDELIFDLSLNKQVRKGDPIRQLDHAAWLEQREATGLTDPEIAAKTGLATEQVTFIRNVTERRLFRLNQYRKLFRLGGGLRYREDRYQDPEEKFAMSDDAIALRLAMRFAPADVKKYVTAGWWTDQVVSDLLSRENSDEPAVITETEPVTHNDLRQLAVQLANGLNQKGVGRGDVVAFAGSLCIECLVSLCACSQLGAVLLPLENDISGFDVSALLDRSRARLVICETDNGDLPAQAQIYQDLLDGGETITPVFDPVAADPILLTYGLDQNQQPKFGILTHQNLLHAVHQMGQRLNFLADDRVDVSNAPVDSLGIAIALSALAAGATITTTSVDASYAINGNDGGWVEIVRGDNITRLWGDHETLPILIAEKDTITTLSGVEVRAVNSEGAAVASGENGAIQVRGPSVFAGYLNNAAANADAWTADGWYRTPLTGTIIVGSDGANTYLINGGT